MEEKPMVRVSVKMPEDLLEWILEHAEPELRNKSQMIRVLLIEALNARKLKK
jgi:metal-responsive CopG/Arc/MetJ family transcriptional regulator